MIFNGGSSPRDELVICSLQNEVEFLLCVGNDFNSPLTVQSLISIPKESHEGGGIREGLGEERACMGASA
jgi:hypothetical protein